MLRGTGKSQNKENNMQRYQLTRMNQKYKGKHVRLFTDPKKYLEGIFVGYFNGYCLILCGVKNRYSMKAISEKEILLVAPVKKHIPGEEESLFQIFYSNLN